MIMKKINLIVFLIFLITGCSQSKKISEQDVKDTIYGMFDSFSVESDNKKNLSEASEPKKKTKKIDQVKRE